jgi:hypothetical protein
VASSPAGRPPNARGTSRLAFRPAIHSRQPFPARTTTPPLRCSNDTSFCGSAGSQSITSPGRVVGYARVPVGVVGPLRINGLNAHGDLLPQNTADSWYRVLRGRRCEVDSLTWRSRCCRGVHRRTFTLAWIPAGGWRSTPATGYHPSPRWGEVCGAARPAA